MTRKTLTALCTAAALVLGAGCTTTSANGKKDADLSKDPKAQDNAHIHYDLGLNAQAQGDVRTALNEFNLALQYEPGFADAENALGILYHLSFRQLDEAEKHYKQALALKPDYSGAKVNLAALYLDEGRYDEAIALDEEVLKDLEYKNQYLPANNEGWAWYKKGDTARALALIQETVRANPEFCQGYRNLGLIYADQGKLDLALTELQRMVKKCPESAQGFYDLGRVQLRAHDDAGAMKSFQSCKEKSKEGDPLLDDCTRLVAGGKP